MSGDFEPGAIAVSGDLVKRSAERHLTSWIRVYRDGEAGAHATALDMLYQCVDRALLARELPWVSYLLAHAHTAPDLPESIRLALLAITKPWAADLARERYALESRAGSPAHVMVNAVADATQTFQIALSKDELTILKYAHEEVASGWGEPLKNIYELGADKPADPYAVLSTLTAKIRALVWKP